MENINQRPKKIGPKKSKLSVLSVIFSGVLGAGALAGSGVAIWQIAKNYTEAPEFTKTVSGRVEINPFANYEEGKQPTDRQSAESALADCAEKLSRWLKDQGQKSYDVSYELYAKDEIEDPNIPENQDYVGYLNAQFELDKVERKIITDKDEEDEKIDNDPYLSFFNEKGFNTNEKTLVYRWYINTEGLDAEPQYTVIPFRDLFSIPDKVDGKSDKSKVLVDKDANNGVVYKVENTQLLNQIFENLTLAKKDSEEKDPEQTNEEKPIDLVYNQPRMYIVNNINGFYNEVNYHLANWWANQQDIKYRNIYEGSSYASVANTYKTKTFKNDDKGQDDQKLAFKLANAKNHDDATKPILNGDAFNYVDMSTAGTVEADWSFANKYINKIVTMKDFDKFMPKEITEDYTNKVEEGDVNISYFWYQTDSKNTAEKFLNNEINYGFNKASISNFNFSKTSYTGEDGAREVMDIITKTKFRSTDIAPSFSETIFGGDKVVITLSIGFLIFLVALLILLAALYRTTGIMSWITMMFALAMTLLIATIGSSAISLSLIFGLFAMSIAGLMAALAICGRMKRRLYSNEDTQLMIKKTFMKSLLPIMDISIIALIFGICFTYIAPISLNPLGLVLIIGGFAIFISEFLLNGLLHVLFFNNRININKYQFFGKPSNIANEALAQSNMAIPTSLDATKLEFGYYSTMSKKKLDVTSKKTLIAVAITGALLIIAIVIFTVLGWRSSSMFHTSNCLAVMTDEDLINNGWLNNFEYITYKRDTVSGWWYFYTNANNLNEVAQSLVGKGLTYGSSILIQNIFGSTNQDTLNFALISLLVAAACCSVYVAIRHNWISFVPMLVGAYGIPMIILGLSAAVQVKFDQFVVLAFVLVFVVNTLFCMSIINNINESWSRKDAYNKIEFKFIVNVALANSWTQIWNLCAAYLLFIAIFGVTAPVGLLSAIILMLIGAIVIMFVAPFVMAFLLYQFMKVRNRTLNKMVEKNQSKVVINYDEIDEQGIEGINKFTKRIPVAKEQQPKEVK